MTHTARVLDDPDVENGVRYPSSDGKPMAETDFHVMAIRLLLDALEDALDGQKDVHISGNSFFFWVEGDPSKRRAPDAMVVFGVEKGGRRSFRTWKEGGAIPSVCFEVASKKTWKANLGAVKDDYEAAGVKEYFVFDPLRDCLPQPLMGYRLKGKTFRKLKADGNGAVTSEELGLCLIPEGRMLRLIHLASLERVLTRTEQTLSARAETSAIHALAEQIKAENVRLRAQIEANGKSLNGHS